MPGSYTSFDPRKKYEQIYESGNAESNYGIRMVMAEASEVSYTTMFNLNNLLIRIEKEKQEPQA